MRSATFALLVVTFAAATAWLATILADAQPVELHCDIGDGRMAAMVPRRFVTETPHGWVVDRGAAGVVVADDCRFGP